ncbi:MAG: laccase domain-containing protein, partial [Akkermansia sp.]|nr:laccase domain-containing protein [Akkermansia sp.]
ISPCIRPPHYEVDIPTAIKAQLLEEGLAAENIIDSELDTAADLETFYSYRMEKGNTGRMLALFGRMPETEA